MPFDQACGRLVCVVAVMTAVSVAAVAAGVTYQFVDLGMGPPGYNVAEARGVGDRLQVGFAQSEVNPALADHALLWSGSAASLIDLNPAGFTGSYAYAVSQGQQVGSGWIGPVGDPTSSLHALLWYGSADSCVDLTPGASRAVATSTDGHQQGGYGASPSWNNRWHALLWSGSAASVTDLNPDGYAWSGISGMGGGQQVGEGGSSSSVQHALLWTGTPSSIVDLHPASGFSGTYAWDTDGQQQVGTGYSQTGERALVWSGSAQSVVDLTPSGFASARAYGVAGGYQVGAGPKTVMGPSHALLWAGSPDNYVDLQTFVPSDFAGSVAYAIDAEGLVVGDAWRLVPGQVDQYGQPLHEEHAVMWVPVPEPATLSLLVLGGLLFARRRVWTPGASPP